MRGEEVWGASTLGRHEWHSVVKYVMRVGESDASLVLLGSKVCG